MKIYSYSQLFKYFIISNSTFYWWGAWLSKEGNKQIICSDKFINKGLEKSLNGFILNKTLSYYE